MEDKTILKMWAISVLGALEGVALVMGIDGTLFGAVIAAIAGIAGYEIGKKTGEK